jgi:hypothetical protein
VLPYRAVNHGYGTENVSESLAVALDLCALVLGERGEDELAGGIVEGLAGIVAEERLV